MMTFEDAVLELLISLGCSSRQASDIAGALTMALDQSVLLSPAEVTSWGGLLAFILEDTDHRAVHLRDVIRNFFGEVSFRYDPTTGLLTGWYR